MPAGQTTTSCEGGPDGARGGLLRLGHDLGVLRPTCHNGPGWRIGIWLQGCSLRCTSECLTPHLLEATGGFSYPVDGIVTAIVATAEGSMRPVEGVTVLGGEPTDQLAPLLALLSEVRERGLTTMVYTGLSVESLVDRFGERAQDLLRRTDILVDGPFVPALFDEALPWRGSRNQRLITPTNRYTAEALEAAAGMQRKAFSFEIRPDGTVSVSGFQERIGASGVEAMLWRRSEAKER